MEDVKLELAKLINQKWPDIDFALDLEGQLDSLRMADLLTAIEQRFEITFPTANLIMLDHFNTETLSTVISHIQKQKL